jgi:hypothetical protein
VKRSRLSPGAKSLQRGSTFGSRGNGLTRSSRPRSTFTPASPAQRAKVRFAACVVCASSPVDPAHLIDRSMGAGDEPVAVIPLCRLCHRAYDDGRLSVLEHLEPTYRDELAHAVHLVGLIAALQRITNQRWAPERTP